MSTPNLLDLHRRDPSGKRAIVIENLQANVRKDNLQNYLEVICSEELTDIHFPVEGAGVAIAIFENDVEGIDRWKEEASKRRFEGSHLSLQLLSRPGGVFIADVPKRITEEYLGLYFESRKSGGEEDSVQNIQIVEVGPVKHAFVEISSENAIDSVLSKPIHHVKNTAVKLEPYYRTVHRYVTEALKQRYICKEAAISPVLQSNIISERTTAVGTASPSRRVVKPQRVSSVTQENEESATIHCTTNDVKTFDRRSGSPYSVHAEFRNYDSHSKEDVRNSKPRVTSRETLANDFKLKIISDDPEDQIAPVPSKRRDHVVSDSQREDDSCVHTPWQDKDKHRGRVAAVKPVVRNEQRQMSNDSDNSVDGYNIATVKPVAQNVQRQMPNDSEDGNGRSKNPRRKRKSKGNENQISLSCEAETRLPPVKVIMLIIFRFQMKTQTDTLKIFLKEKEGKVIIKGNSDEDVTEAKLKIHECLDQIVCRTESLSRMKCMFLSRQTCRNCLRTRCIKQKVRAAFEVDETTTMLRSYAFTNEDAERGLQFVKDEIVTVKIQLRPGQEKFLKDEDWKRIIETIDSGLTTIYQDETAYTLILIESFFEPELKEAKSKIIQYLKQHVPKKAGEVVLEEAKARCFKSCFEDKFRRDVEKRKGKFDVDVQSRAPFRIRICVEGDESLTAELTKMVEQIWHEKIDFSKISVKAEDRWLIMKGLDSTEGKEFFKNFEKCHSCFIQVSKDGELKLEKPKIQIDDNEQDICQADATDMRPVEDAQFEVLRADYETELEQREALLYERRQYEKQRERKHFYQADMEFDEAMAHAIEKSMEDQYQDQEILHPVELYADDDDWSPLRSPRRQQSDGDIYEGQYAGRRRAPHRNMRRSASSPLFQNQQLSVSPVPQTKTESIQMMQTTVTLIQGEIVKQQADVLVNIVSPSHSLTESIVSKAFVKRAGPEIIEMYDDARRHSNGGVVKTDCCGNLRCSSVFHVVLQKGERYCQEMINKVMSEVFEECENNGYTSVTFPPLGVGRMYKCPPETVAERMLAETYLFLQDGIDRIDQVTVVIYDDATYAVFEKAFKSFDESAVQRHSAVQARPFYKQNPFQIPAVQNPDQQNVIQSYAHQQGELRQLSELRQQMASQQKLRLRQQQLLLPLNAALQMPTAASPRSRPQYSQPSGNNVGAKRHTPMSPFDQLKGQRRVGDRNQAPPQLHRPARPRFSDQKPDSLHRGGARGTSDRETRNRHYRTEQADRNYSERPKVKQKRTPRSRFPEKKPAPNLTVAVISEKKDPCVRARNELGKRIKEEFLHEDNIDKRQKISEEAKRRIVLIIDKHNIESIKERQKYILRGHKQSVAKAKMEILEVLLEEKENTEKRRKRKENAKRETKEFVQYMVEEEPEVPTYWKKYKPDVTLKSILTKVKHALTQQNYDKVDLDSNGNTFKTIVRMVNSTFDSSKVGQGQDAAGLNQFGYSQLYVVKIQRIENLEMYDKFTSARQKVFLQLFKSGDVRFPKVHQLPNCTGPIQTSQYVNAYLDKDLNSEINEVLLFHGTKYENIGTICTSGLDQRLGSGKSMFGPGIYGAESSTKADQYSDDKTTRTAGQGKQKKMFLIRMVLGNTYLCNDQNPHKYRRPPCTTCFNYKCKDTRHARHKFGHMFNSVVGDNGKLFREFVVYDSSLCYPEYLITYERR